MKTFAIEDATDNIIIIIIIIIEQSMAKSIAPVDGHMQKSIFIEDELIVSCSLGRDLHSKAEGEEGV